jgi:hypothetical protein
MSTGLLDYNINVNECCEQEKLLSFYDEGLLDF